MTKRTMLATLAALTIISLAGSPLAQTRRPLQPDDIFEIKNVGDPRISPDGQWIAYTVSTLDRKEDSSDTDIFMVSTDGGAPIKLTASKKPETSPRWSPDGRYLAFLSSRDGKKTQVYLLDRRGGEAQAITDYKTGASAIAWSPDSTRLALLVPDPDPNETTGTDADASASLGQNSKPKPHVITRLQFKRDGDGYLDTIKRHIHVFDIAARSDLQVTSDKWDDGAPVWSPDGKLLAFSANRTDNPDGNDNSDIFLVEPVKGAAVRKLTTFTGSDSSPAFSPDGKSIAYLQGGDSKDIWYATNNVAIIPVAGGAARILTTGVDRNLRSPQFNPNGEGISFLLESGGNVQIAWVPLAGGAINIPQPGEQDIAGYDFAKNGNVAILQSTPQLPNEIFVVRASTCCQPTRLTRVNDEFLSKIVPGPVERFKAKSADGTMIDGYLTRPPNEGAQGRTTSGKLPTILRIHGGPVSQYSTGFNLEWQMLAAQGFAVVAANPRGSSGYGRDFSRAIWADWGNKDFDDVIAAVDHVVTSGVADPDRLGVGGWSYGGILTNHVISKTSRFKAAISGASEFNYLANYGTDHYQRQWEAELGLPWQNTAAWIRISPFYRLDKIVTPTLVLGGSDDVNVPILGGEQLYQGLKRLGRETELIVYPGETHSIRRPSFQKDRYERYVAWYSKYLKPKTSSSQ
jgi:dipeptidyl aminopeptidase/acylaminoacyl peptidase